MIIGLRGKPWSGKTEVAKILERDYDFHHYEMSDPITDDVKRMVAIFGVELGRWKKEQYREMLQGWGLNARTFLGEDFFLDRVFEQLKRPAVIGGVRNKNEIERIQSEGEVWMLTRKLAKNGDLAPIENALSGQTGYNRIIENDGTLDDLAHIVSGIMAELRR